MLVLGPQSLQGRPRSTRKSYDLLRTVLEEVKGGQGHAVHGRVTTTFSLLFDLFRVREGLSKERSSASKLQCCLQHFSFCAKCWKSWHQQLTHKIIFLPLNDRHLEVIL